jgi:hypothetical protein
MLNTTSQPAEAAKLSTAVQQSQASTTARSSYLQASRSAASQQKQPPANQLFKPATTSWHSCQQNRLLKATVQGELQHNKPKERSKP